MRFLRKWVLAIALFLTLAFDGSLSFYMHQVLTFKSYSTGSLFLPIAIMLIALFDDVNSKEIWLAFFTGLVADCFFLGILGVNLVFLPLASWLCQKIARFWPETFWARLIIIIIGCVAFQIWNWGILRIVGLAVVPINQLVGSLVLTAVWSIPFFFISYWIWGNLAQSYPFLIDLDAYRQ